MKSVARGLLLVLAVVTGVAWSLGVQAQFDPGEHEIRQFDRLVGVILVPEREIGTCVYEERWFLFDEYVYPGERNPVATTIEPVEELSEEALLAIDEERGHWVTVKATEHTAACEGRS